MLCGSCVHREFGDRRVIVAAGKPGPTIRDRNVMIKVARVTGTPTVAVCHTTRTIH
ncbi:hypothetical protein SAMN05216251_13416 [Actinacidiphila alni]|uniref:Uncharacterized protein n=1 Tax=Actinacidiphila alni TaxID=380248 RepID=A0A1I2MFB0_9ACTN|nr:hypothetical protein SAMN05216251_13416 [Actinacidiphila alni]